MAVVKDWIEQLGPQDMPGTYWQKYLLSSMIRVFAAAGRKEEAIATWKEALAMDGIHASVKEDIGRQLAELQGESATAEK